MKEHWVQLVTKWKKIIVYCTNFFAKTCQKKRGNYTNRIKVLPLDILEGVIETAYISKKDDEDDDAAKNRTSLILERNFSIPFQSLT